MLVMDRDLWLSSSNSTLGALLATQADMDDVLSAATRTRPPKRRTFPIRRSRKRDAISAEQLAGEQLATAKRD